MSNNYQLDRRPSCNASIRRSMLFTRSLANMVSLIGLGGTVSRDMLKHYSHIRMLAKRKAVEALAKKRPQPSVKHQILRWWYKIRYKSRV
jgi:hypothetical protein